MSSSFGLNGIVAFGRIIDYDMGKNISVFKGIFSGNSS